MSIQSLEAKIIALEKRLAALETSIEVPGNFTSGSVLFADANGVVDEDNTHFFWDDTNNRLQVTEIRLGGASESFYETGNWTPDLQGATTPGSFNFSTQVGRYTRIGNIVVARARLIVSSVGSAPVGRLDLIGLPLTIINANATGSVLIGRCSLFNFTANALFLTGRALQNSTTCQFFEVFDNAATGAAPSTGVQANTDFEFTIIYERA